MDASDTAMAKESLLELIDRNIAQPEAKPGDSSGAGGRLRRTDGSREGESLRRQQMAWQRQFHRSMNGFWKHRHGTEGAAQEEPRGGGEPPGLQNKNVTNEANFFALQGEKIEQVSSGTGEQVRTRMNLMLPACATSLFVSDFFALQGER